MLLTFADIDRKTQHFLRRWKGDPWTDATFREIVEVSWIYHDNALEGVVLAYEEIKHALLGEAQPGTRLVPAFQEIVNYRRTLEFVRAEAVSKKPRINLELLKKIHTMLVDRLPNAQPGKYRRDIPLHRSYYHDITPPDRISNEMRKLSAIFGSAEYKNAHPIRQAALLHYRTMQIFPFSEISGKVVRLATNVNLLHRGYLPAILHAVDRQRYYESLRAPNPEALQNLTLEAMDNGLDNAIRYFLGAEEEVTAVVKVVATKKKAAGAR